MSASGYVEMSAFVVPTSSFWVPFWGLQMRLNTKVTFAMRDLDRLKCIQAVVDGDLKSIRAADRLGLTTRQVRRLARRYAAAGPVGLISKRFGRPSNNRTEAQDPARDRFGQGDRASASDRHGPAGPAQASLDCGAHASANSSRSMGASITGLKIARPFVQRWYMSMTPPAA
jgi:hypothetical protein